MNVIRQLLRFLGLATLVWTEDCDGAVRLRCVRTDGEHDYVYGIGFYTKGRMLPDGTVKDSYVHKWFHFDQKPDVKRIPRLKRPTEDSTHEAT